ncbi:VOC family protein [Oceanobacillus jordanicus]|uniref:VOC domain-containing protein n=1 Tax=Oceanobacillus jordanicus TaxID=2867266 RepID=A0AAW5B7C9_9BACI|nr:VOC family protein [Oceanobacillus jordanicus]MCG3419885.1 hypothetical protein [Oceanobacillus jordanicus]
MKKQNGRVVGFEMNSQEPEKAAAFYANVFGWEVAEPKWDYWAVKTGEDGIDGGIAKGPQDYPHGIRVQIEVDSINETIAQAVDNGAMVVREKMDFDTFYLAYLVDPSGVGIGLVEQK